MRDDSPLSSSSIHSLLRRAAGTVAAAIEDRTLPQSPCPDPQLERRGGVFVTLKLRNGLVGCIGYVEGPSSLWETVARAAEAAALRDPRFDRLTPIELDETSVEVSVLSEPVRVQPEEFVPGVHGLILRSPEGDGLLLPQVATEHGLGRDEFLRALCQKAGVAEGSWRDPQCRLLGFTVQTAMGSVRALAEGTGTR